ncbi:hypothetical protein CICLE_v10017994mg [Citrus x clementina]|uniref:Uncharacterized protein n=1 Tax=Citrus clementina TaxID=85681 RepID=V4UFP9_CITCL|nr:hypothetical protein CICLE_v10017994mg [Citrus x clementina]
MLMAMANALTATTMGPEEGSFNGAGGDNNTTSDIPLADGRDLMTSLRGASRFVPRPVGLPCQGQSRPRLLQEEMCRRTFKTGSIAASVVRNEALAGQCVNVMSDKKHCGRCSNRCKKGSSCTFGMCSYA